jgi:hypothetical protein
VNVPWTFREHSVNIQFAFLYFFLRKRRASRGGAKRARCLVIHELLVPAQLTSCIRAWNVFSSALTACTSVTKGHKHQIPPATSSLRRVGSDTTVGKPGRRVRELRSIRAEVFWEDTTGWTTLCPGGVGRRVR